MSLCEVSSVVGAVELFLVEKSSTAEVLYMKNEGNIHDSYEVRFSDKPCYVLQKINNQVFKNPEDLMSNLGLVLGYLKGKETEFESSLEFVPTYLGKTLGKNDFGYWRMMSFLGQCGQISAVPPTLVHAKQSAKSFGLFSKYLMGFNGDALVSLIPGFHDTCRYLKEFEDLIDRDPQNRLSSCKEEVDFLQELTMDVDLKKILEMMSRGIKKFPCRVIHGDAKYSNAALSEDGSRILSVIDLDTVMKAPILYDLGDFLRTVCPNVSEEETNIDLLYIRKNYYEECLGSYLDGLGGILEPVEKEYLYMSLPLVCYELSLRFISDYLRGDFYFKTNHAQHNLERSQNQIFLTRVFLKDRGFYKDLHNKFS